MTADMPQGHLGNLTPEQDQRLRELWQAVLQLYAVFKDYTPSAAPAAAAAPAPSPPQTTSRFGIFRRRESQVEPAPQPAASSGADARLIAEADKMGVSRELVDLLVTHSPETIRNMVIGSVKGDHPDALALRFLRARKWDVPKALTMMFTAMDWRYREAKVDADVMANGDAGAVEGEAKNHALSRDFMKQCRMGKSFLHGTDRENRPICYVRVRLHRSADQVPESIERYTTYLIETARFTLEPPGETACLVFDLTNFTLANMDYVPVKFIIKCFEANYPESLGAILIHNAPWVFKGIWKIIHGWLDPVVASKVHFTYNREGLEEFIAPDQIIKELGGDEDWEYRYEEPVAGENDKMKDTQTRDAILQERHDISKRFEETTQRWIEAGDDEARRKLHDERDDLAVQLRQNYWKLDPYVRARSMYDRQGIICGGKAARWYPDVHVATAVGDSDTKEKAADLAAAVAAPAAVVA